MIERNTIVQCDALELCKALPDASVSLIATDPPYFRVVDTEWDRQWCSAGEFLTWLESVVMEFKRILTPNGSLYLFASPQMAARVEVMMGQYFNVLNSIRWVKPSGQKQKASKEALRSYLSLWEAIIFAENGDGDREADIISGYTEADVCLKKRIFGDYLKSELLRAGVSGHQITEVTGAYANVNHGGAASNWLAGYNIPTPEQYAKIRAYLNNLNGSSDYLRREYDELRREYDELRREYDELRQEYEGLRRPFHSSAETPHFDIWHFNSVPTHEARHETQKPVDLMQHIIEMSSRPGDLVVDPFAGSGTTAVAAKITGREFICGDTSAEYVELARRRVNPEFGKPAKRVREAAPLDELPLFGWGGGVE